MNFLFIANINELVSKNDKSNYIYSDYTLNRLLNVTNQKRINEIKCFELILKPFYRDFNSLDIRKTLNGKPYFNDSSLKFNYSHSNDYFVLGLDDYDVGVDIEQISDKAKKSSRMFLNEDELKFIIHDSFFTLAWTLKEALIKKLDLNISNLLEIKILDIQIEEDYIRSKCSYKDQNFVLQTELFEDYFISYTSENRIEMTVID